MSKLMVITCHLSTGGSPQYLLEYLRTIINDYSDIKVIEFTNFSNTYIIQKNKIKELIGEDNVVCLGEYAAVNYPEVWYSDKMKLVPIIEEYSPDVIWMNEFPENYEYKLPPDDLMDYIYREDRPYKLIETTHFNSFDFNNKRYVGDEFMLCSPHQLKQSEIIDVKKYLWEVPMEMKDRPDRNETLKSLGLDPSYVHILNVGLFHVNKNQKYIFEVANRMRDKKVMFHFIGNDCFFNDCGLTQEELDLENYKIWGERSDVEVFMSCMDIYLFPSIKELNPVTIREALSYSMDVIVSRDTYVDQYKDFDNFHIIDEIDVVAHIERKIKKFLLVCSFYNKSLDQIQRTIDSVLNQSYTNWELIVGDDFSDNYCKDDLLEYIDHINDDRIKFYPIKYKYELYLYQNFFKDREYDFFFDLDSDDILDKDILDNYQRHFVEYPNVHSIFCDYKTTNESGKLERYGLVRPSDDVLSEFNIRTYDSTYMGIWQKSSSWSMFGHGRCFRRSEFDRFEIDKRCKTATDSMVLFNTLVEGNHLHLPMDLYTYERRPNSDSFSHMTQEESENYNVNTLNAIDRYSGDNKMLDIYGDIYLETSAIIMSGFKDNISLITNINDNQLEKIEFLYNGRVKVNDLSCENIVVISNKINDIIDLPNSNVCYYKFFDDFSIDEDNMVSYLDNSKDQFISKIPFDNYFYYFRHFISHKNKINKGMISDELNDLIVTEFDGIKLEIRGNVDMEYHVEFIDGDSDRVLFSDNISNNMWTMPSVKYYVNWVIKVNGVVIYTQNLKNKRVMIEFGSSSLGDTLAWFPYLEDFRKKHDCTIVIMTYKNWLFEGLDEYSHFEYINPGSTYTNVHKKYNVGWYYENESSVEMNRVYCPTDFKSIPLQQTITDTLGLNHYQLRPTINMEYSDESPMSNKYVCIAIHSTAQAKYWNYPNGWQLVVDYLKGIGYDVVLVSKERNGYMNNYHPKGITQIGGSIEEVSNYIKHSEFFIGVSSGLTWLAWAIGTPIVLVSGFTEPYTEFHGVDIQRIINRDVCHGCFNKHRLNPSDWNWCPEHKGTDRQFECSKKIHPNQVILGIDNIIDYINK